MQTHNARTHSCVYQQKAHKPCTQVHTARCTLAVCPAWCNSRGSGNACAQGHARRLSVNSIHSRRLPCIPLLLHACTLCKLARGGLKACALQGVSAEGQRALECRAHRQVPLRHRHPGAQLLACCQGAHPRLQELVPGGHVPCQALPSPAGQLLHACRKLPYHLTPVTEGVLGVYGC